MGNVPEDRIGYLIRSALEEDYRDITEDKERQTRSWDIVSRKLSLRTKGESGRCSASMEGNMES